MKDSIKDKLRKLYSLATHENTPNNEKDSAMNFMQSLMKKHGFNNYSEFLENGSNVVNNDQTWKRYNSKKAIDPFIRNIAMIIGDHFGDTILFNGNTTILCSNESTIEHLSDILDRYDYHLSQCKSLLKGSDNKHDYSHGFIYGVYYFFSNKKMESNDDQESIAVINQALTTIKNDNEVSPVTSEETDMGKIKDQRLFMLGLKHGKEWYKQYLNG